MATGKALDGKPYAGNPHVRFDEGEVASAATPRRGSLLYTGKVVLTVGVFDLLHYGHYELFRRAKELAGDGGKLIVAVQEDNIVTKYKPQARLVYDWNTRATMIRALRYVDDVVPYGDVDESIKHIEFDIFAVGGDQNHSGFQRAMDWCRKNGKSVVTLERTHGISSTLLRG